MKKKTLLLGTCLCLMLSVAACGKKQDAEQNPSEVVTTTEQTNDGEATPTESLAEAPSEDPISKTYSKVTVTLGQYKGIEVTEMPIEVTDEEIQSQLDSFQEIYGKPIPLTDRTDVRTGDTVNIDYLGKIDDVAFDGGTATGATLTIGSGQFIPGFEDGLIGKKVGETLDVPCTFPETYSNNPDLAGKEAIFTVTINYIDSGKREELTDAVVAENDINGNKTIDQLTSYIKTTLTSNKEELKESQKVYDIMEKAIANTTFEDLDQAEIDDFAEYLTSSYEDYASQYGLGLEVYVGYMGYTLDEFKAEMQKSAEFNIRKRYLLQQVVSSENITLTEEEYSNGLASYAKDYNYDDVAKFETAYGGRDVVQGDLLLDKANQMIIESAVVIQ